jgi:flagellar export protein FliJ
MTCFHFRLQKVLEWRQKQLELEEVRLKQQAATVSNLDQASVELQSTGLKAELQVRSYPSVSGYDLAALAGFRQYVQVRSRDLAARRDEAQKSLEAQQNVMLEARRRCRLLERLKERRMSEWQAACDRELDELASDSFLAGWVRRES